MKNKFFTSLIIIGVMLISIGCSSSSLNDTPENTVRNFIDAGIKGDKEVFKELIDLPKDEDAFVDTYIKTYSEHAKDQSIDIDNVKIREIPKEEFQEWAIEGMKDTQGFEPIIVEVIDFDKETLLFLLQKVDKEYFIKNIDVKENYKDLFKD